MTKRQMKEPHTLGGIGIDFPHQQTGKYSPNHTVQGNIKLHNSALKSMFHSEAKKSNQPSVHRKQMQHP